jgi:superfamily II DNA/RNA helicase
LVVQTNKCQIICMSATYKQGQANVLASWLKAVLYVHTERVQEISENIVYSYGKTSYPHSYPQTLSGKNDKEKKKTTDTLKYYELVKENLLTNGDGNSKIRSSSSSSSSSSARLNTTTVNSSVISTSPLSSSLKYNLKERNCIFAECTSKHNTVLSRVVCKLLSDHIKCDEQVLIFYVTKAGVNSGANIIAKHCKPFIESQYSNTMNAREKLALKIKKTCRDDKMASEISDLVNSGVGIHHAGLSETTKSLMEQSFKNGDLRILVATSTLAEGVNLPCSVVIIVTAKLYYEKSGLLEPSQYHQKIGRAGRLEYHLTNATSYLVVDNIPELNWAKKLLKREAEFKAFTSPNGSDCEDVYFKAGGPFDRLLLCYVVACKEGIMMDDIVELVKYSFWYHLKKVCGNNVKDQMKDKENAADWKEKKPSANTTNSTTNTTNNSKTETNRKMINSRERIQNSLLYLHDKKILFLRYYNQKLTGIIKATKLGVAVVRSSIPIDEATNLEKWISSKPVSAMTNLSILSCIVPIYSRIKLKPYSLWELEKSYWYKMNEEYDRHLSKTEKDAIRALGFDVNRISSTLNDTEEFQKYERLLNLLILNDVMKNVNDLRPVYLKWGVPLQKLNDIQLESIKMCGKVRSFLKLLNYVSAARQFGKPICNELQPVKEKKMTELTRILSFNDAHQLALQGLVTPREILDAGLTTLINAIRTRHDLDEQKLRERAQAILIKIKGHAYRFKYTDGGSEEEMDE